MRTGDAHRSTFRYPWWSALHYYMFILDIHRYINHHNSNNHQKKPNTTITILMIKIRIILTLYENNHNPTQNAILFIGIGCWGGYINDKTALQGTDITSWGSGKEQTQLRVPPCIPAIPTQKTQKSEPRKTETLPENPGEVPRKHRGGYQKQKGANEEEIWDQGTRGE